VIICGYGRVGRRVAAEFRATGTPCVVVDITPESVELAKSDGVLVVLGDGTEDGDLDAAGLMRARGLVASVDSDEKNLYITLSARAQRSDLVIVARASTAAAARKIELAGANRVVHPYSHAGLHMANLVLKPQVADFLDIATTAGGPLPELRFEEIVVTRESGQMGQSLDQLRIQDTGAVIVALRKRNGAFDVTPGPDALLEEGDVLIGVGTTDEMQRLEELFAPGREHSEAPVA
jgi:voltage-gated potassium channel